MHCWRRRAHAPILMQACLKGKPGHACVLLPLLLGNCIWQGPGAPWWGLQAHVATFVLFSCSVPVEMQLLAVSAAHTEALVAVVGAADLPETAAAELREHGRLQYFWGTSGAGAVLGSAGYVARFAPAAFSPLLGEAVQAILMPLAQVRCARMLCCCCCPVCRQIATTGCLHCPCIHANCVVLACRIVNNWRSVRTC